MTLSVGTRADVYRYVDKDGVAHFTNMPSGTGYKKIISGASKDNTYYKGNDPAGYLQIINSTSRKYNIEPSLVNAVIKVESNWDSGAISQKGAQGLMQLMPSTARDMNVKNPFNPEENIEGGVKYLRYLLDKFDGNFSLALAAYNAGPEKIKKHRGIPPIPETQQYVKQVLSIYNGNYPGNKKPTKIYKVIQNDGTVLYTNTPPSYEKSNLSRL